ncbi:hypothetical protein F2Q69_00008125 [Brassica cretica]|uniref:DC1 domain-containing protein n=1 Tax=Brassica cretica TaxID=69181 RepID=A0A8S9NXW5_BRACR|nr:hypothetical protein F2Q69_00008125 [Brassica cretica]
MAESLCVSNQLRSLHNQIQSSLQMESLRWYSTGETGASGEAGGGTQDCWFEIDVKCASFTDPFKHTTHRCPLYLRLEDHGYYLCRGCHVPSTTVATCTTCEDSSFDFKCLNLPPVIRYKYDVHPLYLYSGTEYYKKPLLEKIPYSWCDVCEKQILEDLLFYVCFDCRIALHVTCILGNYPYMKPGHNIKVKGLEIQIASNSGACRPMCHSCGSHCGDKNNVEAILHPLQVRDPFSWPR